jgi:type IV pilus assembly protein PilB
VRIGIYEIMLLTDEMRELIMNKASTNVLREAARRNGMRTLRENGLALVFDGITTIEEVVRETLAAED